MQALSESQLEAFYHIAMEGSLTKASLTLHISQPALSRRLISLEDHLGLTLFERTPTGVSLTEAGKKLLLFVKNKIALETEAMEDIRGEKTEALQGLIRIAAHSSVLEPLVMPALADFLKSNPAVQVEFVVKGTAYLDEMLNYSKSDIILSNSRMIRKDLMEHYLGDETFICLESKTPTTRSNVYLDVNPNDKITEEFMKIQRQPTKKYVRSFMHDENGILRGIQLGIGRGIKPKHTIRNFDDLRIIKDFKPLKKQLYLRYSKKQYFTRLEEAVIGLLLKEIPKMLK